MTGFYIYNNDGEQIGYVDAVDINEAYKEAEIVTGLTLDDLAVERS
tara:strand:+ start:338 stop:475 length:138 start_codon:yes stop_codon:yes gene_type:complete